MDPAKYLAGNPRRSINASRKQESRVALRMGGSTQPGSGNGRMATRPGSAAQSAKVRTGRRGDVTSELLLAECKTVVKKASISIKQEYLIKITREAKAAMKSPALVVSFPVMPDEIDTDWIMMPLAVWEKFRADLAQRVPAQ